LPYLYGRIERRRGDMVRIQRALEVLAQKDPEVAKALRSFE